MAQKPKPKKTATVEADPGAGSAMPGDASSDPYLDELDSSLDMMEENTNVDTPAPSAPPEVPAEEPVPAPKPEAEPEPKSVEPVSPEIEGLAGDIPVDVKVVIGERPFSLADIMNLKPGQIMELNRGLDPAVDLMVQDKVVARGELVEVDGRMAVRLIRVLENES